MKIFVLHYSKLTERKSSVLEQFKNNNIHDYEFIEKYDKDELNDNEIALFSAEFEKSKASLVLKHFDAYRKISGAYDHALIFEDDIILCDKFTEIFTKYIAKLPDDYDLIFLGDACDYHIPSWRLDPDTYFYEKGLYPTIWGGDGATRCTDSYIISKKGATKLCKYIDDMSFKIAVPIDWWLNQAARGAELKVYWAEPTIVTQGSEKGIFKQSYE